MKYLLIGAAGKQAREYAHQLERVPGVALEVRVDPLLSLERNVYGRIDDALDLHEIDFGVIAVPHAFHFSAARSLLARGIPVIKEKPFALTSDESAQLMNLALQKQAPLLTTVQRRFHPLWQRAREITQSLGAPYSFSYNLCLNLPTVTGGWRADPNLSKGGVLLDLGYHALDLIVFLFGSIEKAFAQFGFAYGDTLKKSLDDSAHLVITTRDGVTGSVLLHRHHIEKREEIEILCTHGMIRIRENKIYLYNRLGTLQSEEKFKLSKSDIVRSMLTHYCDAIQNRRVDRFDLSTHAAISAWIESLSAINREKTDRKGARSWISPTFHSSTETGAVKWPSAPFSPFAWSSGPNPI